MNIFCQDSNLQPLYHESLPTYKHYTRALAHLSTRFFNHTLFSLFWSLTFWLSAVSVFFFSFMWIELHLKGFQSKAIIFKMNRHLFEIQPEIFQPLLQKCNVNFSRTNCGRIEKRRQLQRHLSTSQLRVQSPVRENNWMKEIKNKTIR